MTRSVCIIQGHPHGGGKHLCHAIADAYAAGAKSAGAKVRWIDVGAMDIDLLRNPADFGTPPSPAMLEAQKTVSASDHLVVVYPLWLGTMPAVVKAFFEQLARSGFAIAPNPDGGWPLRMLKGKSARVIVTMGMPAAAYKLLFGAHGVKGFESSILGMSGIKPIRETLVGAVEGLTPAKSERLLGRFRDMGAAQR